MPPTTLFFLKCLQPILPSAVFANGYRRRVARLTAMLTLWAVSLAATGVGAEPVGPPVKIVLIGDSTVNDGSGWGAGFQQYLTGNIVCINLAANGRSSKSYLAEGRWQKALAVKGDYYLIQFGHNDEPGKGPDRETDPDTTYRENMARYVDEARAIGARPILVTSLTRRNFDPAGTGKLLPSLVRYVAAVKKLAAEKNVPLVDLHARSIELCEKLGPEQTAKFNPVVNGRADTTHLNPAGSVAIAGLVVQELRTSVPELAPYLRAQPVSAVAAPKIFNVRSYGATGDGQTLDTAAVQKAIDACGAAGSGIVELPAGTYLCHPIFLRSRMTLQLDEGATLQATDGFDDFADPDRPEAILAFVNGRDLTDLTISGQGVIDGAGAKWWPDVKRAKEDGTDEPRRRPRLVVLSNCLNVRVEGVTLQNSPSFHLVPVDSEDVSIVGVTIRAPADSPNTDAMDPSACRRLRIESCTLDVGDDNIALKSGHLDPSHPGAACTDILVTNCTFLHGHGMSIGSETSGGVSHLRVEHCTFKDTVSGIRIKSDRSRGGLVEDCVYDDLTMLNVKVPINLTTYYPRIPDQDSAQPLTSQTPIYRDIHISNLNATSPVSAGFVVGLPECAISNLFLENVSIVAPKGLVVRNAKPVYMQNVSLQTTKGKPFILEANTLLE
jgi:lysophospholipase L1-like esterase